MGEGRSDLHPRYPYSSRQGSAERGDPALESQETGSKRLGALCEGKRGQLHSWRCSGDFRKVGVASDRGSGPKDVPTAYRQRRKHHMRIELSRKSLIFAACVCYALDIIVAAIGYGLR